MAKGGKIPRLQGGQQKSKPILKPITPSKFIPSLLGNECLHFMHYCDHLFFFILDFKKLHEAHFSKMESIDSYIQRKTKQIDTYRSAVKEAKVLVLKNFIRANLKLKLTSSELEFKNFPYVRILQAKLNRSRWRKGQR